MNKITKIMRKGKGQQYGHIWFGNELVTVSMDKSLKSVYVTISSPSIQVCAYRDEVKFLD